MDLDQSSQGTLLVIIAEQQGVISELRQQVESLEARLSGPTQHISVRCIRKQ